MTAVSISPAAPNQQRLWLMAQLYPDNPSYHIESSLELTGDLEVPVLRRALRDLMRRHEALRTTFADVGRVLQLRVSADVAPQLHYFDVSAETDPHAAALERAAAVRREPMDLGHGPLFKVLLCRTGADRHVLTLVIHHILADGWSLGILWDSLGRLYSKRLGVRVALPPATISYREYAAEQVLAQQSPQAHEERQRWMDMLDGVEQDNSLRTDRPRPKVPSFAGRTLRLPIPAELVADLRERARVSGHSLFMLLVAGFAADLAHYDQRDEVVFAIQTSGRSDPRTVGTIGFFVNTLPLRFRIDDDATLAKLAEQACSGTLAAAQAEHITYEQLTQELGMAGDRSMNPLAQVSFQLMNVPIPPVAFAGLRTRRWWDTTSAAKFDLSVMVVPYDPDTAAGGLVGLITFAEELFEEKTVREIWSAYLRVLRQLADDPSATVWGLRLVDELTSQRVTAWSVGPQPQPGPDDLLGILAARAAAEPNSTAILAGDRQISRAHLWAVSAASAAALRAAGVAGNQVVAVCCASRAETICAVIATWRAGCTVLVLEPGPPSQRMADLIGELGVNLGLTTPGEMPQVPGMSWVRPHPVLAAGPPPSMEIPAEWTISPYAAAYAVTTSGSTGRPRAVLASMAAFSSFVLRQAATLAADQVVVQVPGLGFEPGMRDVFSTLAGRAQLLIPNGVEDNPVAAVIGALRDGRGDTILAIVPSVAEAVARQLERYGQIPPLRAVHCCGDALSRGTAQLLRSVFGCVPRNDYGPTECSMVSVSGADDPAEGTSPIMSIGRPLPDVQAWVLGRDRQLLPPGYTGEIHLGGGHLTAGYVGDMQATGERFVAHPYRSGERLYRTGDLAWHGHDGRLHWISRVDRQVKVRGVRIDVIETEMALTRHPGVDDALVTVAGEGAARMLVGYVVPSGSDEQTAEELRAYLRGRLPRASVPAVLEFLPEIPRTTRGKIRWSSLPPPDMPARQRVPLSDPLEVAIAGAWRDVLGRSEIGADDDLFDLVASEDFFDLGGHSLAAMQMAARASELAGRQVSVQHVFDHPTVRDLAAFVRAGADLMEAHQ
jgi:amino acid adenylation domain-containing protein